jgi:hypothetical protein
MEMTPARANELTPSIISRQDRRTRRPEMVRFEADFFRALATRFLER